MENIFDTRWYRSTKRFATNVGQWPFQPKRNKNFIRVGVLAIMWSLLPPMIRGFYFLWIKGKLEAVVQSFPPILTLVGVTIKYNHYTVNEDKVKYLFNQVQTDWDITTKLQGQSRAVLQNYTDTGRMIVNFYATYIYVSLVIFLLAPNVPIILDVIMPLNESRHLRSLFPVDYGLDPDKYRHLFMIHSAICACMAINVIIACDSMYIPLVCHGCGMFAVVRNRLEHMSEAPEMDRIQETECILEYYDARMTASSKNWDRQVAVITSCIKLHDRAIWYVGLVESCFSGNFLVKLSVNMIVISITGLQMIIKFGFWEEMITAAIYLAAQLLHLFFLSLPGQLILDSSVSIRESAYNTLWYKLPAKTQKLLIPIIMRSSEPCVMSAGSFFVLKMETFSSVVQTSMSYLTVLASFY